jgi:hypothetical protein
LNRLHPHSVGLTFGILLGVWHAFWSLFVLIGVAQWLLDTIFQLHMIVPVYEISSFSVVMALVLIVVTSIMGYVFGWLFGIIWNRYAVK